MASTTTIASSMAVKDTVYYDVLGVEPTATTEEIHEAYLRLEPECNPNGSARQQEINDAYFILRDGVQRRLYDFHGKATEAEDQNPEEPYTFQYDDSVLDVSNKYQLNYNLNVPMEDTYSGFVRKLRVKRYIACAECSGLNDTCDECHGRAKCIRLPYIVAFEAGVPSNFTKDFELNDDHDDRFVSSRVTVTVTEMEHSKYKRDGFDLVMEMWIDLRESTLGFWRVINTIDNRNVRIKKEFVPTFEWEKMVVLHEGFRHFGSGQSGRGNLILFARITDPNAYHLFSSQEWAIITQLQKESIKEPPATPSSPQIRYKSRMVVPKTEEEKRVYDEWTKKLLPSDSEAKQFYEYKKYFPDATVRPLGFYPG